MLEFQPLICKSHSNCSIYRPNYTTNTEKHHQISEIMNCKHNMVLKTCTSWLGDQKRHRKHSGNNAKKMFLLSFLTISSITNISPGCGKAKRCLKVRLNKEKYVSEKLCLWLSFWDLLHSTMVFHLSLGI